MRKLKHVTYGHSTRMDEEAKDELLIPSDFEGVVAIETWEVNGELKRKGVCVVSVSNYILGYGKFKEDPLDECICGDSRCWHDMKGDKSCRVDMADHPDINCKCKKFQIPEKPAPKLKILGARILNENTPEFFKELLEKGVDAISTKGCGKDEDGKGLPCGEKYSDGRTEYCDDCLSDNDEKNPAHYCMGHGCDKYLGHRGFCSDKCHDGSYDSLPDSSGLCDHALTGEEERNIARTPTEAESKKELQKGY